MFLKIKNMFITEMKKPGQWYKQSDNGIDLHEEQIAPSLHEIRRQTQIGFSSLDYIFKYLDIDLLGNSSIPDSTTPISISLLNKNEINSE